MITISIGWPQALVVDQTYALPARQVSLHAMGPGAAGVGSNIQLSEDGTLWGAVKACPVELDNVGSAFIRCTTGIATVIIKPN
jgi:hypothetical protein